jgi:hypothetical protein
MAGQRLGIKQLDDHFWLVSFMHYELGYFDDETCRIEPIANHSAQRCYPCARYKPSPVCPEWTRFAVVAEEGLEPPTRGL